MLALRKPANKQVGVYRETKKVWGDNWSGEARQSGSKYLVPPAGNWNLTEKKEGLAIHIQGLCCCFLLQIVTKVTTLAAKSIKLWVLLIIVRLYHWNKMVIYNDILVAIQDYEPWHPITCTTSSPVALAISDALRGALSINKESSTTAATFTYSLAAFSWAVSKY